MKAIRRSRQDIVFETSAYAALSIAALTILYPVYFVLIASFSDPMYVNSGQVLFAPKGVTFEGYRRIFEYNALWLAYRNSIVYTSFGTLSSVVVTMMLAYPLSRTRFFARKYVMALLIVTMYVNGGLIPTFLVVRGLGLYDSYAIMIIIGMISVFNVIITRSYIKNSIPEELLEAAFIDGASDLYCFLRIVFPLSKPIIAVLALYYGVDIWNDFFNALVYLRSASRFPLQLVLRGILLASQLDPSLYSDFEDALKKERDAELIKYGIIIVSSAPLLMIYPFLQKYFTKGVMIGSVKG